METGTQECSPRAKLLQRDGEGGMGGERAGVLPLGPGLSPFPVRESLSQETIRQGRAWQATPRLLKTITLENIHGQILRTALMETLFKNIMNTQK